MTDTGGTGTGNRGQRPLIEPMASDDQVFTVGPRSPTFSRSCSARTSNKQVTESVSPIPVPSTEALADTLPSLIHDVALDDRAGASSGNSEHRNEGTSVDMTLISSIKKKEQSSDENDGTDSAPAESNVESSVHGVPQKVEEASPPHPKLRRKSSSMSVKTLNLPKVNCPEKIFLCIDHSKEMFSRKFQTHSVNKTSIFKTLTSAIKQFVCTKTFLNAKHQFSLIMLNDDTQLITDFSSNHEELLFMLNDIAESPTYTQSVSEMEDSKVFDLSELFDLIEQQSDLPRMTVRHAGKVPPQHIVRVIFVYGRSNSRLKFLSGPKNFTLMNRSPFFFLDCVYIHEPVQESSIVEAIFSEICALDMRGTSHVYELDTDSNMACLYNIFAKLLAHPLQRPKQGESLINYDLELK